MTVASVVLTSAYLWDSDREVVENVRLNLAAVLPNFSFNISPVFLPGTFKGQGDAVRYVGNSARTASLRVESQTANVTVHTLLISPDSVYISES